jgi:protease II
VKWRWEHASEETVAGDLDIRTDGLIAYTTDMTKGEGAYKLVVQRRNKVLWTYNGSKNGLSNTVAILGSSVYVVEAVGRLCFSRLIQLDLKTGKVRKVLYEEPNRQAQLYLVKGERKCLFLLSDNSGRHKLFHVEGAKGTVRQLSPKALSFVPIGYAGGSTEPCYFAKYDSFFGPWLPYGHSLPHWDLPSEIQHCGIDTVHLSTGLLVLKEHGTRHLFACGTNRPFRRIGSFLGELALNPWALWEGRLGQQGYLDTRLMIPGLPPVNTMLHVREGLALSSSSIFPPYGGGPCRKGKTRSADGTLVHWMVCGSQKPRGLIVTGYGAYGLESHLSLDRWRPYLEVGYAVGVAFVRGGGDDTEAWAEAGRREGKLRGVEDFEACVRGMQRELQVPADRTCIYGRSAGGYLVGATVARHPRGDLFQFAYAEVPYVDVLRTTTNPSLPLTEFEYLEFGNPASKIAEFEAILRLSPVDALGPEGAPGVFVLCRTAANDSQVYAYESAKWVQALRGQSTMTRRAKALLAFAKEEGHFSTADTVVQERAEDFVILTTAFQAKH